MSNAEESCFPVHENEVKTGMKQLNMNCSQKHKFSETIRGMRSLFAPSLATRKEGMKLRPREKREAAKQCGWPKSQNCLTSGAVQFDFLVVFYT